MLRYAALWGASVACWIVTGSVVAGLLLAALGAVLWPANTDGWSFQNKRVLVTGGAGGLGQELARCVLAAGGEVILWDIDAAKLAAVPEHAKMRKVGVDVRDGAAVRKHLLAAAADGKLDAIFVNAGIVGKKRFLDMLPSTLDATLATNVKSVLFLLQAARPCLAESARVCIVSSAVGCVGSIAGLTDYCASKWALTALVEYLKRHMDVPITTLSPSFMTTDMFRGVCFSPLQQQLTPALDPQYVAEHALEAVACRRSDVFLPHIFWVVRLAAAVLPAAVVDVLADAYGIHNAADPLIQ
eukprot:TRINITY_DN14871_c0_g1_i1.p1 TRINITY_DN14871_c0_g1~~TRINITY_DN14871_c0_g1_i1.p1  ORF type:complete len:299 (+),score=71.98 TRINITY_DN14871_c0_g1_i1:46-942(+)